MHHRDTPLVRTCAQSKADDLPTREVGTAGEESGEEEAYASTEVMHRQPDVPPSPDLQVRMWPTNER